MDAISQLQSRSWPEEGAARVPSWVYADQDVYDREQERIFSGPNWSYVALEAEIPNQGDFKRSHLGNREVVAVRGTDGAVNVLVNRCAHRSMQVCTASRGSAKEFVCPYHQWTYDLAGNLLGVPFRRGYLGQGGMPADFRTEDHGLQRLAATTRNGVVSTCEGSMLLWQMSCARFCNPFTRLSPPLSMNLRTATGLPSMKLLGASASVTSEAKNCALPFSRALSLESSTKLLNSLCVAR